MSTLKVQNNLSVLDLLDYRFFVNANPKGIHQEAQIVIKQRANELMAEYVRIDQAVMQCENSDLLEDDIVKATERIKSRLAELRSAWYVLENQST